MKKWLKIGRESKVFQLNLLITLIFLLLIIAGSIIFDNVWRDVSSLPLTNLNDVYKPPKQYDNVTRINLKLTNKNLIDIEANKRFIISGSNQTPGYFKTIPFITPDTTYDVLNKIYIIFENNNNKTDSLYLMISKTGTENIFWNQIFYSSVKIEHLNKFSENPDEFRIDDKQLVSPQYLSDNDTLINDVIHYFNSNLNSLNLAECGTNCSIFKSICDSYNLPCRVIRLQGGDANYSGYDKNLGYPLHAVCEIYSSKYDKWFVIDPTYGFRYKSRTSDNYYSAVEINYNMLFEENLNIIQDSVLATKRTLLGGDYFRYYENIFFQTGYKPDKLMNYFFRFVYGKFNYQDLHFSNNLLPVKNAYNYLALKSLMYLLLLIVYFNFIAFIFLKRLYIIRKSRNLI